MSFMRSVIGFKPLTDPLSDVQSFSALSHLPVKPTLAAQTGNAAAACQAKTLIDLSTPQPGTNQTSIKVVTRANGVYDTHRFRGEVGEPDFPALILFESNSPPFSSLDCNQRT